MEEIIKCKHRFLRNIFSQDPNDNWYESWVECAVCHERLGDKREHAGKIRISKIEQN